LKVTVHVPDTRLQLFDGLKVPCPDGLSLKVTVPVGVLAVPAPGSATVTVQAVEPPEITDEGLHTNEVLEPR
jgi:hypothetical protein